MDLTKKEEWWWSVFKVGLVLKKMRKKRLVWKRRWTKS